MVQDNRFLENKFRFNIKMSCGEEKIPHSAKNFEGGVAVKKGCFLILLTLTAGIATACGSNEEDVIVKEPEVYAIDSGQPEDGETEEERTAEQAGTAGEKGESTAADNSAEQSLEAEEKKKEFGENCIAEQTFEATLSEYEGEITFASFAPSGERQEFYMQVLQQGRVLNEITGYIPESLFGKEFTGLEAVSFFDVNYDGNTDIALIASYGNTNYAAVYYGFAPDADEYEKYFLLQANLSDNLTEELKEPSIAEIRKALTGGKANGEFADYREAYRMVSRLCDLEDGPDVTYNLIDVDGAGSPELAAGRNGYYVSLYAYENGRVYTLMNQWGYGAMGNTGYEYCPGKNSLRNYNTDYAGAILYTTYMTISERHRLDVTAEIVTYNFDDVNGNGTPDEEEMESAGSYSVSYIDGAEATEEECAAYSAGEYEYIQGMMSGEELRAKLQEN
ncbi:MAG: hypothetical protein NC400_03265 [Clostridium sp.]|nr:hypothetical protein [Clostridium sp.]